MAARRKASPARRAKHIGSQLSAVGEKAGTRARRDGRRAARQAKKGAESPWVERSARLGYVVRGLLYGAMGLFGVGYSLGVWHQTTDQRGALYMIGNRPERLVVLAAVLIGLAGYTVWGFVRAIFDPLNRGDDTEGIAARLGFLWSGFSYGGLLLFTVQFVLGSSRGDGSDSLPKTVFWIMRQPFGIFLTLIVGAIAMGVGLGQFVDAYKASFSKDLKRRGITVHERRITDTLGRFGMFSRGVIFTMLGWFVVQAALHDDPGRAQGMGHAFQVLAGEPLGHALLFIVSAGFIALGMHSIALARWIRMPRA